MDLQNTHFLFCDANVSVCCGSSCTLNLGTFGPQSKLECIGKRIIERFSKPMVSIKPGFIVAW